ncbi:MAG TPA: tryptophan synthase subunit alpha [Armatimonadota bacterium]|jgi:tryptophan synthase alpha chain
MTRIGSRFEELKAAGRTAFVGFITAGDPMPDATPGLALALEAAGVDVLELGIPFSDPMADGPSIQAASQRALGQGMSLTRVLDCVREIRRTSQMPIVLMSYYNPMLQRGLERFASECVEAGVDGIIATDLSPEEADPWKQAAQAHNLDTVFLVAPTTPPSRMRRVARLSSGFIYCVSRTGVTGARAELTSGLKELIERIRKETDLPIAVGFGISRPEHVQAVGRWGDGVVVGSSLVDIIASCAEEEPERLREALAARVRWLKGE